MLERKISFVVVCLLLSGCGCGHAQQTHCFVTDGRGPKKHTPCAFPFSFKGQTYHQCTNALENNPESVWCSTQTDSAGVHKGGIKEWGYCHPRCAQCARTDNTGPITGRNLPCQFPFVLSGTTFWQCTNIHDNTGRLWCSTKTDGRDQHVGGQDNWGYCHDFCVKQPTNDGIHRPLGGATSTDQNVITDCTVTVDGPQIGHKCALPFIHKNLVMNGCTTISDPDGRKWCSTRTDALGHHITGNDLWGYCDDRCDDASPKNPAQRPTSRPTRPPSRPTRPPSRPTRPPSSPTRPHSRPTRPPSRPTRPPPRPTRPPPRPTRPPPRFTVKPTRPTRPQPTHTGFVPSTDKKSGTYLPSPEDFTCGSSYSRSFIVGGDVTKPGEFPFVGALGYKHAKFAQHLYLCGASLINRRYALTAAHCQSSDKLTLIEIVLGETNLDNRAKCVAGKRSGPVCESFQKIPISQSDLIIHQDFSQTKPYIGNDIALIRLTIPAKDILEDPAHLISPLCLAWKPDTQVPKETKIVMGWGRVTRNPHDSGKIHTLVGAQTDKLRRAVVDTIPIDKCRTFPKYGGIHPQQHLCAGGVKDSCSGDSGGPLVAKDGNFGPMYLVGIVSFGSEICGVGTPGVYTNVDYYIPWILSQLRP